MEKTLQDTLAKGPRGAYFLIMTKPFPGMNPWLENHWSDVNARLIVYMSDALWSQLPPGLIARVEQTLLVETEQQYRPDVSVVVRWQSLSMREDSALDIAEPGIVMVAEPPIQRYLQIVDGDSGNRVVTAIEVLSPPTR